MHIYHIQCENMQKKSVKELKRPNSVFYAGYVRSSVLKTQKTRKTRKTKTWITQNFPIVWPIQGSTMSKSMPRAFQKCGTFWYLTRLWGPKTMGQIIPTPMCHAYLESPGHALWHGGTLDGSYYWKILSNSRFSFSCFPCFLGFQQRAPDVACIKHWIWPFELFHWIFCMFSHCLC